MQNTDMTTQERILASAKTEFLKKGFLGASLRNIVKTAGVTTGAFYGYYSNKEALFSALVEPHAAAVMGQFMQAKDHFAQLPDAQQPGHMDTESGECLNRVVDYFITFLAELLGLLLRRNFFLCKISDVLPVLLRHCDLTAEYGLACFDTVYLRKFSSFLLDNFEYFTLLAKLRFYLSVLQSKFICLSALLLVFRYL